jgi:phosphoribosylaminoimidazolecarboxamide formyltransferase/IMP cyclohydrolase
VEGGADFANCVENIDIGGPAMIRAAAKNHDFVTVITSAEDYERVLNDMKNNNGAVAYETRRQLAANAFALTAAYDSNISNWFACQNDPKAYPRNISMTGNLKQVLRYGENPHQTAALYTVDGLHRPGAALAQFLQGKELSYNNLNDTNAAFELVSEFSDPAVAIIKHANPCGVATGKTMLEAYKLALQCDPVSAFGGIIALNRPLDKDTAAEIIKIFVEVIIAPSVEPAALEILKKKDKIRVLATGAMPGRESLPPRIVTRIAGGLLIQDADSAHINKHDLKVVTKREPTEKELEDMLFAFTVAKHVKSNAIIYAKDGATVGIGAGQMSRIDSSRIAAWKAGEAAKNAGLSESLAKGSVVASDAFFPFADGLISAAEAGVTAVIQPGGSIRDSEVIEAANERGLAMVFTGIRHFRH